MCGYLLPASHKCRSTTGVAVVSPAASGGRGWTELCCVVVLLGSEHVVSDDLDLADCGAAGEDVGV